LNYTKLKMAVITNVHFLNQYPHDLTGLIVIRLSHSEVEKQEKLDFYPPQKILFINKDEFTT